MHNWVDKIYNKINEVEGKHNFLIQKYMKKLEN